METKKTDKGVVSCGKPQRSSEVARIVEKLTIGGNTGRSSRSVV